MGKPRSHILWPNLVIGQCLNKNAMYYIALAVIALAVIIVAKENMFMSPLKDNIYYVINCTDFLISYRGYKLPIWGSENKTP